MPPQPQKPIKFGEPEKTSLWGKVAAWSLIIVGVGAIAWMIASNTKQKPLVCKNTGFGASSLNSFGTCTTE